MTLDRIGPTRRPDGANAGTQRWRELLFAHWALSPDAVRPLVPAEIELDLRDGRAWVGLVPFRMEETRPRWLPRAFALDFLELTLRTYVHHRGRPAVWFFSLEAASWLAVRAARAMWSLPYHHATMSSRRDGERIAYASTRRGGDARFEVDYEIGEVLGPSPPDTFEHFLIERYLLLAKKGTAILEGQVHHPPYLVHRARIDRLHDDLFAVAGLPRPGRAPDAVHYSPGVDVEVFGPARVA